MKLRLEQDRKRITLLLFIEQYYLFYQPKDMTEYNQKPQSLVSNQFLHMAKAQSLHIIPQDIQKIVSLKRQTSCDQNKIINPQEPECFVPGNKMDSAIFNNYNMGTDVISFEMQEQRNNQMKIITSDLQLRDYYQAFKRIFTILYQASYAIHQNLFNLNTNLFQNQSINFLCLIFQLTKDNKNHQFLIKMKPLVSNMLFLANNFQQFQRRIDLVARKVTLQKDKRQKIKNAFLNPKILQAWQQAISTKYISEEQAQIFVQKNFANPEEKLCFIQIKDFILNKLSSEQFGNQLRKYCVLEQLDDDLSLDFKFEFLLAEEFTFMMPQCLVKDIVKPSVQKTNKSDQNKCMLM